MTVTLLRQKACEALLIKQLARLVQGFPTAAACSPETGSCLTLSEPTWGKGSIPTEAVRSEKRKRRLARGFRIPQIPNLCVTN